MKISIDVIIPSFRLQEKYILPILQLSVPQNAFLNFFIIVDNPLIEISPSIKSLSGKGNIFIIINDKNIGAAESRNKGMDAGSGEWILFLDDDIKVSESLIDAYVKAIEKYPKEIGFIGLIYFSQPSTDFTKAITASGSMDIFTIALRKESFAWGATANIMVKRNAISGSKFSPAYPKSGGGEDVDFFLRVRKNNYYKNYKTVRLAIAEHPWWKNEKIDFKRPFRYGKGNSLLGYLNPEYTYYDFPNTPETILLILVITLILFFTNSLLLKLIPVLIGGLCVIEIAASFTQTCKRYKKANLRVMLYVMLLRFVYECGMLAGKIAALQFYRIGERFHDDGKINKIYFYRTNTYKIIKWILYPLLIALLCKYF